MQKNDCQLREQCLGAHWARRNTCGESTIFPEMLDFNNNEKFLIIFVSFAIIEFSLPAVFSIV